MTERILVSVAWPYANGSIHIGQVAGCYLPADIFARYHRMAGNEVLMVSGADAHGTPVTLTAEQRGTSPDQVSSGYQAEFLDNWERLGISFDLFTSTHTDNHTAVVQEMFLTLLNNGYIYKDTMMQPYCETDSRFLADRYVEGTCPHCGTDGARGDQCDSCGRTLDPKDLIGMACRLCGGGPEIRETEHFFLKLSAFEERLQEWVADKTHWKPNVRNFTRGYLDGGLHDRAITRDIEWGVPVPLEGYATKRIYVWFEAVIGYLSASKEWARTVGAPERWREFWQGDCRAYYFMGKDNIPFHTVIWPAMLMGSEGLNLPYDVPANEFLNLEGLKLSTSRNWAVWLPDYLDRYEPDPLRYVVASNMPETSDSDFSWKEYVRSNNDELVATYGNLVHRVLTMTVRNFDGRVPARGPLDGESEELLDRAESALGEVGRLIESCSFRLALGTAMGLAHATNRYLDRKEPWRAIRSDRDSAAGTLWAALAAINCLKTLLYPFLPFSSQRLHGMLGLEAGVHEQGWRWDRESLRPDHELQEPRPLFAKLEEALIEQESLRIGS